MSALRSILASLVGFVAVQRYHGMDIGMFIEKEIGLKKRSMSVTLIHESRS